MTITITDYQILAGLFTGAVILHFLTTKVLTIIASFVIKTKTKLDDYLIKSFSLPMKMGIWLVFLYTTFVVLDKYYKTSDFYLYLDASIIIIVMILVLKLIKNFEHYLINEKDALDNSSIRLFAKLSKIVIIILFILTFLQFLGINISSVLAFGGVGGLVIGMAAKDMLANIFGGLMISLDKPFAVGDWIRVDGIEGTVEQIGWRTTRVRTFSKNPIYVPNSLFSTNAIETPSRMTNRRIKEVIGVRYDDISHIKTIVAEIKSMLNQHPDIDKTQTIDAYFELFNNSSLDITVVCFTTCTDKASYQVAKSNILLNIAEIVEKCGADFAYPTQTIKLEKQ